MSLNLRRSLASSDRIDRYRDEDLSITPAEQALLDLGDLRSFWLARLGKDPMARVGLSMWGTEADVRTAVHENLDYWKPDLGFVSKAVLKWLIETPANLAVPPLTDSDVVEYWRWLGAAALARLEEKLISKKDFIAGSDALNAMVRQIGIDVARTHSAFVTVDLTDLGGEVPGLLSREQMIDSHKQVFKKHGLPANTFGGAPLPGVIDRLDTFLVGDTYADDADPSAKSHNTDTFEGSAPREGEIEMKPFVGVVRWP